MLGLEEVLEYAEGCLTRRSASSGGLRFVVSSARREVGRDPGVAPLADEMDGLLAKFMVAALKGGWRKDSGGECLQRPSDGCRLTVARPVLARGLEFDAVVVVEPADFEPNLGRHGKLYTSLTRANHELVVIHGKAIPRELRGRGNRVRG